MGRLLPSFLWALLAPLFVVTAPTGDTATASTTITGPNPSATVPLASDNPNYIAWNFTTDTDPEPERGPLGGTILAQKNIPLDQQNPDILAPPTTDNGIIPGGNVKWPFSLSPNRLLTGGWSRQQNVYQLPIATAMAGVDMRLQAGAIRELHWHQTAEWAYVLNGYMQVTAVDQDGRNFLGTVGPGDLWYFPPGIPHSLQATNQSAEGAEFLLIFDNGDFSDDGTFLLTDWLAHIPKEVLARNFQTDIAAWDNIPGEQLYIFPGEPPSPQAVAVEDPQGQVPNPYTLKLSDIAPTELSGGTVKIVDSRTFPVSTSIALAEVTVEPGGMRELHWHPTQDEWTYYISGTARVTEFAATSIAQTFDYSPGDIGYVPASYGHYVENTGNETLHYLEIFNTAIFEDVSLQQWLALIPPQLVKEHLQLSDETISHFRKTKQIVVGSD